ncbi:MAG: hypothetical protein NVS9B10_00530 [Nevskia sp.]
MPILHFHLAEGAATAAQHERLLVEASRLYADVLKSPIDRVRVFIQLYPKQLIAIAGRPSSENELQAPYFHFLVLEGRPLAERHALLRGFTDLLVEILGVDRPLVRGGCWPIAAEDWAIAGTPASAMRAAELQARAAAKTD